MATGQSTGIRRYNHTMIRRTCLRCGRDFLCIAALVKHRPASGKFCSRACTVKSAPERFWEKVNKDGPVPQHMQHLGPCWQWTGATQPRGYGTFQGNARRVVLAHRFSYELATGHEVPPHLMVCHHCDNPSCVRPDHLFLGDGFANQQDSVAKGRATRHFGDDNTSRRQPELLPRGEQHSNAKLTADMVRDARDQHSKGASCSALARQYNVGFTAMSSALKRQTWRHVV